MANINKIQFDGNTLIDLTGDTVGTGTDKVLSGYTFHGSDGAQRTGTATALNGETRDVTLSTNPTTYTPSTGKNAITSIKVTAKSGSAVGVAGTATYKSHTQDTTNPKRFTITETISAPAPTVSAGWVTSGIAGSEADKTVSVTITDAQAQAAVGGPATIDVTDKTVTAGTLSGAWDATNNKYNITQAQKTDTMQSTVTTAGYISSTVGTKNTGSLTVNGASMAISGTNVVEKAGSVSGTTYTQGKVTVDTAGYIPTGDKVSGATFGNAATSGVTYKDISGTTAAPELVSGDYLYINKGYTDAVKISLAKLIPDTHGADIASDKILQGYDAYDKDGSVVAGSIPTKSDSGNVTLNASTTSKSYPAGYYPNAHGAQHSTVSRADTTLSSSADTTNAKLTFTASNNQGTGYVTGANKTATATVTLTSSGNTVTASDGTNSVSKSVAAGSAGTPTATKSAVSNNQVSVTPSVSNTTGWITGGEKTGTAVTVSASELVSGNKALSSSTSDQTNIDVTNYQTVSVSKIASGSATGNAGTITYVSHTQDSSNKKKFTVTGTVSAPAPTVSAGYVSSGTAGSGVNRTVSLTITDAQAQAAVGSGSATGVVGTPTYKSHVQDNSNKKKFTITETITAPAPTVSAGYVSSGTAGTSSDKTVSVTITDAEAQATVGTALFSNVTTSTSSSAVPLVNIAGYTGTRSISQLTIPHSTTMSDIYTYGEIANLYLYQSKDDAFIGTITGETSTSIGTVGGITLGPWSQIGDISMGYSSSMGNITLDGGGTIGTISVTTDPDGQGGISTINMRSNVSSLEYSYINQINVGTNDSDSYQAYINNICLHADDTYYDNTGAAYINNIYTPNLTQAFSYVPRVQFCNTALGSSYSYFKGDIYFGSRNSSTTTAANISTVSLFGRASSSSQYDTIGTLYIGDSRGSSSEQGYKAKVNTLWANTGSLIDTAIFKGTVNQLTNNAGTISSLTNQTGTITTLTNNGTIATLANNADHAVSTLNNKGSVNVVFNYGSIDFYGAGTAAPSYAGTVQYHDINSNVRTLIKSGYTNGLNIIAADRQAASGYRSVYVYCASSSSIYCAKGTSYNDSMTATYLKNAISTSSAAYYQTFDANRYKVMFLLSNIKSTAITVYVMVGTSTSAATQVISGSLPGYGCGVITASQNGSVGQVVVTFSTLTKSHLLV